MGGICQVFQEGGMAFLASGNTAFLPPRNQEHPFSFLGGHGGDGGDGEDGEDGGDGAL